jgi:hypothetical protein
VGYKLEGDLLGRGLGADRGARALALCALPDRVAAERQGPAEAHRQAAADCADALGDRKRSRCVGGRANATCQMPTCGCAGVEPVHKVGVAKMGTRIGGALCMTTSRLYHDGSRALQDQFDSRRLADHWEERITRDAFSDVDKEKQPRSIADVLFEPPVRRDVV